MRVELLHVEGCANLGVARARVMEALRRLGLDAEVDERLVTAADVAAEPAFGGSPTILVDGRDPFPASGGPPSLACRLYANDEGGLDGAPTAAALAEALGRSSHQ